MPNITIYSTPTCHYCIEVKKYLSDKDIKYTDYNVAKDLEKRKEMVAQSGSMGVPVVVIGDKVILGFDKEAIDKELAS